MAQLKYRGNLSAKVFPFLSSQMGPTVIVGGQDQSNVFQQNAGDSAGGDNNIPQAYYMHNVVPTAQGYKSVGYSQLLQAAGILFNRVVPIRDPDMTRGWLGATADGHLYIYKAGDSHWWDVTDQAAGWAGGNVTVAYANGTTYICLAGFKVFKVGVSGRTLTAVTLNGITSSSITAITSSVNYMILTDGVSIYWSSTLTPEDFVPSTITGAGSGKVTDIEGLIVALVPLNSGFAVYSAANVVIAAYSQNAKYPWIFRAVDNSKGVTSIDQVTSAADSGSTYAWTAAGLQKISITGALTLMPEVTDFLAGQEFEDFDYLANTINAQYLSSPLLVRLAYAGARYLIISYGISSYTHALVYDTALKRWGKLRRNHVLCFEININASAKQTIGFADSSGAVTFCDFDNAATATDSVLVLGKYQMLRSRLCTLQGVSVENVDASSNFEAIAYTALDGKTISSNLKLTASSIGARIRNYPARVTGTNHSIIFKGRFNMNSFELTLTLNGRR